jgi:glucose 1-dehydrogenase
VTGGNRGIGAAIVLERAKQGANIVIDYVAHPQSTVEIEKQVTGLGDQAPGVEADVSKVAELQRLVDATVKRVRVARRAREQCRHRDPDQRSRHDGSAIRQGNVHQFESALFATQIAAKQMIEPIVAFGVLLVATAALCVLPDGLRRGGLRKRTAARICAQRSFLGPACQP